MVKFLRFILDYRNLFDLDYKNCSLKFIVALKEEHDVIHALFSKRNSRRDVVAT